LNEEGRGAVEWGDDSLYVRSSSFYAFERKTTLISRNKVWGVDLVRGFPHVVAIGISFPFDQVLEGPGSSMTSVADNALHYIFGFSFDKVRWWSGKVRTVRNSFMIGR